MSWNRRKGIASFVLTIVWIWLWTSVGSAAFLDVGLGARPVGLGRAFVALADDANAMLYNPAGLAYLERMELTSTYARLYPGIEDDKLHLGYLGVTRPLGTMGTAGFGITNLWADLYSENVLYFSYARNIKEGLSLGGSLKLLRWSAEGYTDPITEASEGGLSWSGFTLDVGALYTLDPERLPDFIGAHKLQLGLAAFNLNQPAAADNGADAAKLPLGFEGGLFYLRNNVKILISYSRRDEKSKLHLGQETELWNQKSRLGPTVFVVRAGAYQLLSEGKGGELDFGCGFALQKALIDYAYVFPLALKDAGGCHKVSIGYAF